MKSLKYLLCCALCGLVFSSISLAEERKRLTLKSFKALQMQTIERQTLDYSCGAASLAILLTHYFNDPHGELPLLEEMLSRLSAEEIAIRLKEGFSILDLKKLLARLGYASEGVILPPEAITKLAGPVIILLNKGERRHFVVLKGAREGKAFLTDPILGNIRLPIYELLAQWKGETLIVGREDVELPTVHGLSLPKRHLSFPEEDLGRSFQFSPPQKPSMPYS